MAQDFNSFSFVGRMVEDLNLVEGSNGKEGYGRARMVTSNFRDEKSVWVTVFFPESVIGRIHAYMTKGKPLAVSGRLSMDNYTTAAGVERTGLSLNATSVDFVASGQPRDADAGGSSSTEELPF